MPPRNLDRLPRVYGPTTWDAYERLDVSLDPHGPDSLLDLAGQYLQSGDVVFDAGCRDAEHLIRLIQANEVTGVGVDPVEIHIERARVAVADDVVGQDIYDHVEANLHWEVFQFLGKFQPVVYVLTQTLPAAKR